MQTLKVIKSPNDYSCTQMNHWKWYNIKQKAKKEDNNNEMIEKNLCSAENVKIWLFQHKKRVWEQITKISS